MTQLPNSVVWEFAFLPWVFLETDREFGRYRMRRIGHPSGYAQGIVAPEAADDPFSSQIVQLLSNYVSFSGERRDGWTIFAVGDRLTYPADNQATRTETRKNISDMCEIVAFASICCNELFRPHGQYANSSVFRPVFQELKAGNGYIGYMQHRKGQSMSHGWGSDTRISEPLHCHALHTKKVNGALERALLNVCLGSEKESSLGRRLRSAIHAYLRGYTDDPSTRLEDEIIYQVAALEALYGSKGKVQTATKLTELFKPLFQPEEFADCSRFDSKRLHGKSAPENLTFWNWFIELYDLRSTYQHCDQHDPGKDVWTPEEHRIMSAEVFISAVLCLLAQNGLYELSLREKAQVKAYEPILGDRDWASGREPGTLDYVKWEQITNDVYSKMMWDHILKDESSE